MQLFHLSEPLLAVQVHNSKEATKVDRSRGAFVKDIVEAQHYGGKDLVGKSIIIMVTAIPV